MNQGVSTESPGPSSAARRRYPPLVREREMDRDGVAVQAIFPQVIPFKPLNEAFRDAFPFDVRLAGVRAYNRWLAEFCSHQPERHAGVAQILTEDIDVAVREVRWARRAGLFGGIQLPLLPLYANTPEAFYHHPRFEPLWAVCEELEMPMHSHIGGSSLDYGAVPSGSALRTFESMNLTAHRHFWFLLYAGALERHPTCGW